MTDQNPPKRQLPCDAYTVAWITILREELSAALAQLDEEHLRPDPVDNRYTYRGGTINGHNIVIARTGEAGPGSASKCAEHIRNNFPNIEFGLLVGIGGGLPTRGHDIRLGDIVISKPENGHGGVAAYEGRKLEVGGIKYLRHLNAPPDHVMNAVYNMEGELERGESGLEDALNRMRVTHPEYVSKVGLEDVLHVSDNSDEVDTSRPVRAADDGPHVHLGLIASGPLVIKSSGKERADILDLLDTVGGNALCFEMEACGVMGSFPFLVIRGISDYCDSHKHDGWHRYAAAVAACFARWLLQFLRPSRRSKEVQDAHASKESGLAGPPLAGCPLPKADMRYKVGFKFTNAAPAPQFVGREEQLVELTSYFRPDEVPTQRKIYVISGIGGVGKTQLCLQFARKYKEAYSACIWIDGSSIDTVKQSFRQFASRLSATNSSFESSDGQQNDDLIISRVLDWLSLDDNKHWLLVVDNVDLDFDSPDPEPLAFDVEEYIPQADHGSVIVTTRLRSLEGLGVFKNLESFDSSEAQKLLEAKVGKSLNGNTDAEETLKTLGGLPLAIALAGAFVKRTGSSFRSYNQQYASEWEKLTQSQDRYKVREYGNRQMLTTWLLSFKQLRKTSEPAANLFQLWSFLNRTALSYELIAPLAHEMSAAFAWPVWLQDMSLSQGTFQDVMQHLVQFSLAGVVGEETYSMHALLHQWSFSLLTAEDKSIVDMVPLAFVVLGSQIRMQHDSVREEWRHLWTLVPHAINASERMSQLLKRNIMPEDPDGTTALHLFELSRLLRITSKYSVAQAVNEYVVQAFEESLGQEDEMTLDAVGQLAILYSDTGQLSKSEAMCERALRGNEKLHGPENQLTLKSVGYLGYIYYVQGKFRAAEEMYERARRGLEESLGPEHLSTLDAFTRLGCLYRELGRLDEAESLLNLALKGLEKSVGVKHVRTASALLDLGRMYLKQKKYELAAETSERALQAFKETYGLKHRVTLAVMAQIAAALAAQDKLAEAEEMHEQTQQGFKEVLGPEHPETLIKGETYGWCCEQRGKLGKAEKLYEGAQRGFEKLFGAEHADTLRLAEDLRRVREKMKESEDEWAQVDTKELPFRP